MSAAELVQWARREGLYVGGDLDPREPADLMTLRFLHDQRATVCRVLGVDPDAAGPVPVPPLDPQMGLPWLPA